MRTLAARLTLVAALCCGCEPHANTLTVAVALLPSELPVYRTVLADFERDSGLLAHQVVAAELGARLAAGPLSYRASPRRWRAACPPR